MTPRDRAEKIVERFLSTPEGFAPDDKQALIAAIEQGMNEVLEDAATLCDLAMVACAETEATTKLPVWIAQAIFAIQKRILSMKSPDTPRNTIVNNQKDEKR